MSIGTTRTRGRIRRCVAAAAPAALVLVFPLSAHAIDPGVNYDPGSPAGKEYAIPFVQGRAEGAGTTNQRAAANTPFGVGITPPGGGTGGGSDRGGGGNGSAGGAGGGNAAGGTGAGANGGGKGVGASRALRGRIAQAEDPGGTGLWTLGIALAVLLSATLFALVFRPRRQQAAG